MGTEVESSDGRHWVVAFAYRGSPLRQPWDGTPADGLLEIPLWLILGLGLSWTRLLSEGSKVAVFAYDARANCEMGRRHDLRRYPTRASGRRAFSDTCDRLKDADYAFLARPPG